jgi:uncharacterized protein (TIGR02186 family)
VSRRDGIVLALVLLAGMQAGHAMAATELTVAISKPIIRIGSNYQGSSVTVFGTAQISGTEPCSPDVVVTLRGPDETAVIRSRVRSAGIWINDQSVRLVHAPSLFKIAASRLLEQIAVTDIRAESGVDIDTVLGSSMVLQGAKEIAKEIVKAGPSYAAWRQSKASEDMYSVDEGAVTWLGDRLFSTTFSIPATARVGPYEAVASVFCGGRLRDQRVTLVQVVKAGISQRVFEAAQGWPILYGLGVTVMALLCGLLASFLFARPRMA